MTTITALTDLSKLPNQSQDQATFDANMAYYLENLALRGQQENALAAALNSIAAGGAYAIPYVFGYTGTLGGTSSRFAVVDAANQSATTYLYFDKTSFGANVNSLLQQWDDSSSQMKGVITVRKLADPSKYITFNVVGAIGDRPGDVYFNGTVVGSSSTNPFALNDAVIVSFQRTGDKGDTGATQMFNYMKVSDRKPQNTGGGGPAAAGSDSASAIRTLNTVEVNTVAGASLASNIVTLPAGTYDVRARAPSANAAGHRLSLFNVTDNARTLLGATYGNGSAGTWNQDATLSGRFTISAAKTFHLRHFVTTSDSSAYGIPTNMSGQQEIYAELEFWKVG